MDASVARFPHLDHFLNAYMHQDWRLFGDSVEAVLLSYAKDTSPDDIRRLRAEIDAFIAAEGDRLEQAYRTLYPNSVLPSGWGMNAGQWLRYVAKAAAHMPSREIVGGR